MLSAFPVKAPNKLLDAWFVNQPSIWVDRSVHQWSVNQQLNVEHRDPLSSATPVTPCWIWASWHATQPLSLKVVLCPVDTLI